MLNLTEALLEPLLAPDVRGGPAGPRITYYNDAGEEASASNSPP